MSEAQGKREMDEARLEEIAAREKAATPGPWDVEGVCVYVQLEDGKHEIFRGTTRKDVELISQAREDILAMVAEIRRCWAEIEALKAGPALAGGRRND
jgi:hypothetical protein